jgi:hypothetical protein
MTSLGKWGGSGSGHGCRYRALEIRGLGWHQSYQQICMSTPSDFQFPQFQAPKPAHLIERDLELGLIGKLEDLKYAYCPSLNSFTRDDVTLLNYTLVNIKDWCKNHFEVTNQLRINTDNSHHRYDVVLLINGIPIVQIELKTLGVNPRRAMEQIVEYKNDPGNGYTKTLLCFLQLFIVSNREAKKPMHHRSNSFLSAA